MAKKKSMRDILKEMGPKVEKELRTALDNDPNSMRNILKRERMKTKKKRKNVLDDRVLEGPDKE